MLTDLNRPTLLLVEDSEDDAFFFNRTLQKSGVTCSVRHVLDGAQAIEFLREASQSGPQAMPYAMFLDLKMPVMSGFEVLDWMRQQTFPSAIPVIVLSGSEQEQDKDRAMELGATAYLVKPVTAAYLQNFLRDVCPANVEMGATS